VVVGTGLGTSADDWLIDAASRLRADRQPFWLVTSDRALKAEAGRGAERILGGGSFVRELVKEA
jgi:hypothetical protein